MEQTLRFIPTRVGNTERAASYYLPATVHPRARGEHRHSETLAGYSLAVHPRARGEHAGRRSMPTR